MNTIYIILAILAWITVGVGPALLFMKRTNEVLNIMYPRVAEPFRLDGSADYFLLFVTALSGPLSLPATTFLKPRWFGPLPKSL